MSRDLRRAVEVAVADTDPYPFTGRERFGDITFLAHFDGTVTHHSGEPEWLSISAEVLERSAPGMISWDGLCLTLPGGLRYQPVAIEYGIVLCHKAASGQPHAPFRGVISGRPYPSTGLTGEQWIGDVPVCPVAFAELVIVLRHRSLTDAEILAACDPTPHVVEYANRRYLECGHYRTVRAGLLAGLSSLPMRVYRHPGCRPVVPFTAHLEAAA